MNTPEFLMWAIEFSCPIRGFQDGSDPERTERQLRAARATSDAQRDGRIFEEVAVRGEEGFRIEKAMRVYGGSGAVEDACGNCLANVLGAGERGTLAGCYGMVVCPLVGASFHLAVDGAVEVVWSAENGIQDTYPRTKPAWYGLWLRSPLEKERALFVASVLEGMERSTRDEAQGLEELAGVLLVAAKRGSRVHVAVHPEGSDSGGVFSLAPHCPRCKMTWRLNQDRGVCPACGYEGFCAPLKQRKARGRRPYFPLSKLLGEPGAREFLNRYAAYRAR